LPWNATGNAPRRRVHPECSGYLRVDQPPGGPSRIAIRIDANARIVRLAAKVPFKPSSTMSNIPPAVLVKG
jgi:hypothetical protein